MEPILAHEPTPLDLSMKWCQQARAARSVGAPQSLPRWSEPSLDPARWRAWQGGAPSSRGAWPSLTEGYQQDPGQRNRFVYGELPQLPATLLHFLHPWTVTTKSK
jgi:hypothetical protein